MTAPDITGLCERLRAVESIRNVVATNWHRNPDGPEAADLIERLAAMLAASPQGKGSSGDAPVEVVAWRVKDYADGWILFHHEAPARKSGEARNGALVQPLYTHPAPIKTSADTGELRERVAASIGSAWAHGTHGKPFDVKAETDAILDLIQSERAGSPIGQNDQPGLAFSDAGEP